MNRSTKQDSVREHYKDSSRFGARVSLYARFGTNPLSLQRWIFDQVKLPEQSRVLELGCGPGGFWLANRDLIPPDWRITLTDFSPGMLQEARQNLSRVPHDFSFANADAQDLPFPDASFDVVIANHMMYHVPDRPKAFAEIKRVLRPSGRFYASTLGKDHLKEMADLAHTFNPEAPRLLAGVMRTFSGENGRAQLSLYFNNVQLHLYKDTLLVTEAEPLVAYVRSTVAGSFFDQAEFTRFIEGEIDRQGTINISSDTVLFEAFNATNCE